MEAFEISEQIAAQRESGRLYREFLRVPDLSMGIYTLASGADDPQLPHREDEVYVVAAGRGSITVAGETRALEPGSIVYVGKQVEHRFHDITEDLSLLVLFAPAQSA